MELITIPIPKPTNKDPTKYSEDNGSKKNPTPKPITMPPPMAQVLLSSFWVDILIESVKRYFKITFYHSHTPMGMINILCMNINVQSKQPTARK
jgi:hypothetical protein